MILKYIIQAGVLAHIYNPSNLGGEARGWQVRDQCGQSG